MILWQNQNYLSEKSYLTEHQTHEHSVTHLGNLLYLFSFDIESFKKLFTTLYYIN